MHIIIFIPLTANDVPLRHVINQWPVTIHHYCFTLRVSEGLLIVFSVAGSTVKWPKYFFYLHLNTGNLWAVITLPSKYFFPFWRCFNSNSVLWWLSCKFCKLVTANTSWHPPPSSNRTLLLRCTSLVLTYTLFLLECHICFSLKFILTSAFPFSMQPVIPKWHLISKPSIACWSGREVYRYLPMVLFEIQLFFFIWIYGSLVFHLLFWPFY